MYEECGDVDKIINSEHVTPRFVYKHLALAYLNPKIIKQPNKRQMHNARLQCARQGIKIIRL